MAKYWRWWQYGCVWWHLQLLRGNNIKPSLRWTRCIWSIRVGDLRPLEQEQMSDNNVDSSKHWVIVHVLKPLSDYLLQVWWNFWSCLFLDTLQQKWNQTLFIYFFTLFKLHNKTCPLQGQSPNSFSGFILGHRLLVVTHQKSKRTAVSLSFRNYLSCPQCFCIGFNCFESLWNVITNRY